MAATRPLGVLAVEWLRTDDTSELDIEIEQALIAAGHMRHDDAIVSIEPEGEILRLVTESGQEVKIFGGTGAVTRC